MALPLGELARQVNVTSPEVGFVAEVLGEMRKFPAVLLPLPLGEVASRSDDGEGADPQMFYRKRGHCTQKMCNGLLFARRKESYDPDATPENKPL